jgi:hypothetical protein
MVLHSTYLLKLLGLLYMAQYILHQGMQDVKTVYLVATGDGKIEAYKSNCVGLRNAQRRVQTRDEI